MLISLKETKGDTGITNSLPRKNYISNAQHLSGAHPGMVSFTCPVSFNQPNFFLYIFSTELSLSRKKSKKVSGYVLLA